MTKETKPATVKVTMAILAVNRKAGFDYEISETFEAGIELSGSEVKSIKAGRANLTGSFVVIRNGEAFLLNAFVPPYQSANAPASDSPEKTRKLLLHKSQIRELIGASAEKGLTMVPLRLYTKNSRIKLEFGLARRKKKYDKREKIRKREDERKIDRALKNI